MIGHAPDSVRAPVRGVSFSPDGRLVLSGCQDGTVQLWDATNGKALHPFRGHTSAVWCVAFSPDGRRALSTAGTWGYNGYRIGPYQFGDELPFDQPVRHRKEPFFDCTLRIWDVATGVESRRFGEPGQ
jgi:WD40 repeat protein